MLKQHVWIIPLYQLLKDLQYEQIRILKDVFLMAELQLKVGCLVCSVPFVCVCVCVF